MLSSAASASAAVRGGIPSWELGGSKREGRRRREERRGGESGGGRWCPAKATRGEGRARERGEGGLGIWGDFFFSLSFFARFASHSLFLVVSLCWLGFSRRREGRGKEECTVGRVHGVGPMWRWVGGSQVVGPMGGLLLSVKRGGVGWSTGVECGGVNAAEVKS